LYYASNPPWTDTRLSLRAIREGQREFHLRLANVYNFFRIHANIEGFDPRESKRVDSDDVLDRWIRAELDDTVRSVTQHLDQYLLFEAARDITAFVDGLSNWYVRRSRDRFWGGGDDSLAALWTLWDVLVGLSKVIAPFVPFMAEGLYSRLVPEGMAGHGSVHLQRFPTPSAERLDTDLQERMALIRELASLGLAARAQVGVRVRQPLLAAEVVLADSGRAEGLSELLYILADELNVREIRFSDRAEEFVEFNVKPNFRALGKRLGKEMKLCAKAVAQADPAEVRAGAMGGGFPVDLPSGTIHLTEDDIAVTVQAKASFQAASSAQAVVALHADLNDDLREEGLSREIVNRIATERKRLDLGYTDRIAVTLQGDAAVVAAAERFAEHISKETLATTFDVSALADGADAEALDDHRYALTVEKA
jgi:isoleucyl-tRNA synthetase